MNKNGGEFEFNGRSWGPVLDLAKLYGWEPMGTVLTEDDLIWSGLTDTALIQELIKNWNGSYYGNDFQIVEEEDAINLAHALMNAVKELPDKKSYVDNYWITTRELLINHFSDLDSKIHLKKFIQFCIDGEFIIF